MLSLNEKSATEAFDESAFYQERMKENWQRARVEVVESMLLRGGDSRSTSRGFCHKCAHMSLTRRDKALTVSLKFCSGTNFSQPLRVGVFPRLPESWLPNGRTGLSQCEDAAAYTLG